MSSFTTDRLFRGKLSVFLFHKVPTECHPDAPPELDVAAFREMLDFIAEHFRVIPLEEALVLMASDRLPPSAACITFDDGYDGLIDRVIPELEQRGMHATFYITTGQLTGQPMWFERVFHALIQTSVPSLFIPGLGLPELVLGSRENRIRAVSLIDRYIKYQPLAVRTEFLLQIESACGVNPVDLPCLTIKELRQIHNRGFAIGAHTESHPILSYCDAITAYLEIARPKELLESLIRAPVTSFAFPNGRPGIDFHSGHIDMLRNAGYKTAVTTQWGFSNKYTPALQIPRFSPWGPTHMRMRVQMWRNLLTRPRLIYVSAAEGGKGHTDAGRSLQMLSVDNSESPHALMAWQNLLRHTPATNAGVHLASRSVLNGVDGIGCLRSAEVFADAPALSPDSGGKIAQFRYFLWLLRHAFAIHPDVMHGNNGPYVNRVAILVAKLLGIPYVQHLRGPLEGERDQRWLSRPDAFIAASRRLHGDLLLAGVSPEKVDQIYDGVDLRANEDSPAVHSLRETYSLDRDAVVVMALSASSDEIWMFLEAITSLPPLSRKLAFLVLGNGEKILERMATHTKNVIFVGNRDDIPQLLPQIDIAVSVADEPPGWVMLEAIAAGCVFVAPRQKEAEEILQEGKNGFLFSPHSPQSLAEKLQQAVALAGVARSEADMPLAHRFNAAWCAQATYRVMRNLYLAATGR